MLQHYEVVIIPSSSVTSRVHPDLTWNVLKWTLKPIQKTIHVFITSLIVKLWSCVYENGVASIRSLVMVEHFVWEVPGMVPSHVEPKFVVETPLSNAQRVVWHEKICQNNATAYGIVSMYLQCDFSVRQHKKMWL